MKLENAKKKLQKASNHKMIHKTSKNEYSGKIGNQIVSFMFNDEEEVGRAHVRHVGDHSDVQHDYFAGQVYPSLHQAIEVAQQEGT
ncbi:MAG: hypothetical protein KAS59_00760 [Alphaproteobacteria bacterium]|nr:hypothetical protein [Alphaproteobacteria bacterium]